MKSRMVILTMLVVGMLLSTAGAGLALSSSSNDAAQIQYGTAKPPSNDVLGDQDSGQGTSPTTNNGGGGNGPSNAVQPSRQVQADTPTAGLPFTGFAAVPILLGGIVLLSAGLVLRRRTSGERR